MNDLLFNAILAMDSYNRCYDASIVFGENPGDNNYSLDTAGVEIVFAHAAELVFHGHALILEVW